MGRLKPQSPSLDGLSEDEMERLLLSKLDMLDSEELNSENGQCKTASLKP